MKGKYLISTDNFFTAPDGKDYQAVWGNVEIVGDDILGIKTNARSANWFAKVGTEDNHVIVAGCQIHYAVKCENRPSDTGGRTWETKEGECIEVRTPNKIYFTES